MYLDHWPRIYLADYPAMCVDDPGFAQQLHDLLSRRGRVKTNGGCLSRMKQLFLAKVYVCDLEYATPQTYAELERAEFRGTWRLIFCEGREDQVPTGGRLFHPAMLANRPKSENLEAVVRSFFHLMTYERQRVEKLNYGSNAHAPT